MSKKPYRDTATLVQIVEDGWSRGFDPEQTVSEAKEMGYTITIIEVKNKWAGHTIVFNEYMDGIYRNTTGGDSCGE